MCFYCQIFFTITILDTMVVLKSYMFLSICRIFSTPFSARLVHGARWFTTRAGSCPSWNMKWSFGRRKVSRLWVNDAMGYEQNNKNNRELMNDEDSGLWCFQHPLNSSDCFESIQNVKHHLSFLGFEPWEVSGLPDPSPLWVIVAVCGDHCQTCPINR